jgi:DNA-binding response OmpR family regulator
MSELRVFVFSLDLILSKIIVNRLLWFGFKVGSLKTFKYFWSDFYEFQPDLIVVDDSCISKYVFSLVKKLNQVSNVPVIFLTNDYSNIYQIFFLM